MMVVGSLQVELLLPGCGSLKEKRMVLKGLKDRIRNQLNISVAEVDHLDKWQRAILGFTSVSNEVSRVQEVFSYTLSMIEREDRVQIIDQLIEIF